MFRRIITFPMLRYCLTFMKQLIPFSLLSDNELHPTLQPKKFKAYIKKRLPKSPKYAINESELINLLQYFEKVDFKRMY